LCLKNVFGGISLKYFIKWMVIKNVIILIKTHLSGIVVWSDDRTGSPVSRVYPWRPWQTDYMQGLANTVRLLIGIEFIRVRRRSKSLQSVPLFRLGFTFDHFSKTNSNETESQKNFDWLRRLSSPASPTAYMH